MTDEYLKKLVGTRVVIVADDFKGYGKETRYVGQKGIITGWQYWKPGRFLPIIKLNSGEEISKPSIWWDREDAPYRKTVKTT